MIGKITKDKKTKAVKLSKYRDDYPKHFSQTRCIFQNEEIDKCLLQEFALKYKEDKWQYYFGRFLVGYDINNFTFFDFIGSNNINDAKGINIKEWQQLLLDTQKQMQEEPNKFYLEPNERKEEHLKKYNVPMGYMKGV